MEKVLVVGASRGIGLEFCRQYRARGADVFATCRSVPDELRQLGVTVLQGVDATDMGSLEAAAAQIPAGSLDLIVHNAGILAEEDWPEIDFNSVLRQLEVNAVGPLKSAKAFLPRLKKGGKIAFLTSRMGSIADNTSGGYYGYRMSKAALNAGAKSLALDLRAEGTVVALLHPGYVQTDMTGHHGDLTPEQSVRGLIRVMDRLTPAESGRFWHTNGESLPW